VTVYLNAGSLSGGSITGTASSSYGYNTSYGYGDYDENDGGFGACGAHNYGGCDNWGGNYGSCGSNSNFDILAMTAANAASLSLTPAKICGINELAIGATTGVGTVTINLKNLGCIDIVSSAGTGGGSAPAP